MRSLSAVLLVCGIFALQSRAANLVEDFNAGIPSSRWDVFANSAAGAAWNVTAPDSSGAVQIAKSGDTDAATATQHLNAGIRSKFSLVGDFSAFVDFTLPTFPLSDGPGWNEAVLRVGRMNSPDPFGDDAFMVLRFSESQHQNVEGFSNLSPFTIGATTDSTMSGKLGITRSGNTLSAWIDRGSGPVLLGSMASSLLSGPMNVQLLAAQAIDEPLGRPHTALDVRFDNFTVIADSIVPEPTTCALLACGAVTAIAHGRRTRRPSSE